jgi:hypothetical protein
VAVLAMTGTTAKNARLLEAHCAARRKPRSRSNREQSLANGSSWPGLLVRRRAAQRPFEVGVQSCSA